MLSWFSALVLLTLPIPGENAPPQKGTAPQLRTYAISCKVLRYFSIPETTREETLPPLITLAGSRAEYSDQCQTPYGTQRTATAGFQLRAKVEPWGASQVRVSLMAEDAWIDGAQPRAYRQRVVRKAALNQPIRLVLTQDKNASIQTQLEVIITEVVSPEVSGE